MSRKKTKSSNTSAENPIVIQDEEAKENFDSIFKNQHMMPEKGVNLESSDKMVMPWPIQKTIDALDWNYFCDVQSLPKEELVREFYTNLTMTDATEVLVRKKKVPLTSKSINDLFNLVDVEEDEYFAMMTNIN
ncbi:hypothetical protein ES319_D10G208500v1 [Gossypium barbadense]|uniref:Uncharacterized protein n=1 Tax=Gossypium barbadense TaxID=3634 RepID=A0A5J5PTL0_GOSBA|nr:hypothetical protein ES319_D10G208500v1 [Gossypium barbadense]